MTTPDPLVVGSQRRQVRERAMSLLYEAEIKEIAITDLLAGLPVTPDPYVQELIKGVEAHQVDIDSGLEALADRWPVSRMPAMDRAILRMASFELSHCPEVPTGVVISEAVELAQEYSTPASFRFVNGLLARLADIIRPPECV